MWEKNYFLLFCQGSGEAGARDEEAEICVGEGETEGEEGVVMDSQETHQKSIFQFTNVWSFGSQKHRSWASFYYSLPHTHKSLNWRISRVLLNSVYISRSQ